MSDNPLVAVLDYGIGNLRSAQKSLQRVGADAVLTDDHEVISRAAGVVLPGVGHFGRCVQALRDAGLAEIAVESAASGKPFLGICVGMQMMFEASTEAPGIDGLGIFEGTVELLPDTVKRPQMQWNTIDHDDHPLFDGLPSSPWLYFVHSYAAPVGPDTIATCDYGATVTAVAARDNIAGTQFHPEKSSANGLRLLANFVDGLP